MGKVAWKKPTILVGQTKANDSMADEMTELGSCVLDSTSLDTGEGSSEKLQNEQQGVEDIQPTDTGETTLTTNVIVKEIDLLKRIFGGTIVTNTEGKRELTGLKNGFAAYSADFWSFDVFCPTGIAYKAPKTKIKALPQYVSDKGMLLAVTFTVVKPNNEEVDMITPYENFTAV